MACFPTTYPIYLEFLWGAVTMSHAGDNDGVRRAAGSKAVKRTTDERNRYLTVAPQPEHNDKRKCGELETHFTLRARCVDAVSFRARLGQ